jgi:hypothetical protein
MYSSFQIGSFDLLRNALFVLSHARAKFGLTNTKGFLRSSLKGHRLTSEAFLIA